MSIRLTLAALAALFTANAHGAEWPGSDNPYWFNHYLERNWQNLPTQGRVSQDVWTSSYFPLYEDSINDRWNAPSSGAVTPLQYSPAEKYDQAFNSWTPPSGFNILQPFSRNTWNTFDPSYHTSLGPLASYVTENRGNLDDREVALERRNGGTFSGWPMQGWWGHCHAWAPAAMLEKQACGAIDHNGVTFYPGDLEALLIFAYDLAWQEGQWIGQACREPAGQLAVDELGRPTTTACADPNPGSFHLIVSNFVGIKDRPLIYDRIKSEELWNQPLIGYRIASQNVVTAAQANARLGTTGNEWSFNPSAAKLVDVRMEIEWVTEAYPSVNPTPTGPYERTDIMTYILELDADERIIGGEFYGDSLGNVAPDYLWQPEQLVSSHLGFLDLDTIRGLIDQSCGYPVGTTPTPVACPENILGSVGCSVEGQECNNTWFQDIAGYDTARCENGQWISISGPSTPSGPVCGNGTQEAPEACDDGNTTSGDGCSASCTVETTTPPAGACTNGIFGNGYIYMGSDYVPNTCANEGQECASQYFYDLGSFETAVCSNGSWILAGSTPPSGPICGNGQVEAGETCDDGNTASGDSCSASCQIEVVTPPVADACPNGVFSDGNMYDSNSIYGPNICSTAGSECASTYFYGLGEYRSAICNGSQWIPQ